MAKLKTTTKTVIDIQDWDDFVQEVYGRPYNFQQQEGCRGRGTYRLIVPDECYDYKNDSIPESLDHNEIHNKMGVSFKAWLARDPKQPLSSKQDPWDLTLWWSRHFYPAIQAVANDLHKRGLLEAGEYTILIDW